MADMALGAEGVSYLLNREGIAGERWPLHGNKKSVGAMAAATQNRGQKV